MKGSRIFSKVSLGLFLVAAGQVVFGLTKVLCRTNLIDFQVYYGAAQKFLLGANPYRFFYANTIPFNYPPGALVFFIPLVALPFKASQILWLLLQGAFLLLSLYVFSKRFLKDKPWLFLVLAAFLLQNFPAKFTLVMGQVNFMVLFFLILSLTLWWEKKRTGSGLFLGLAAVLKATPLFLLIFFMVKRSFKTAFVAVGTFAAANLVFLLIRPEVFRTFYFQVLPSLATLQSQGHYYDQSFLATLSRFGWEGGGAKTLNFSFLAVLTVIGISKLSFLKSRRGEWCFFSYLLLLITVFNNFAWQHHLVFLFPAFLWAAHSLLKRPRMVFGSLLALSAITVGFHFRQPDSAVLANPFVASHGFGGAMLLAGLILSDREAAR